MKRNVVGGGGKYSNVFDAADTTGQSLKDLSCCNKLIVLSGLGTNHLEVLLDVLSSAD